MIEVKSVSKMFKELKAVNNLSFNIEDGEFLALLGPNGAGKTTTIKMMIGLLDPSEGVILYDGDEMNKKHLHIKMSIGVVSQHVNLDKELTVEENMIFAGKLYHMKKDLIKERMDSLMSLLQLEEVKHRVTKKLSGGMKRKLMIAKALIHDPEYIFLDEPTVGIDVHARRDIWKFLKNCHYEGKTIILTTHYIEEAEQLCDKIRMMNKGQIFIDGTTESLIEKLGVYKITCGDDISFYRTLDEAKATAQHLNEIYKIEKTNLEDVFYHYTKEYVCQA